MEDGRILPTNQQLINRKKMNEVTNFMYYVYNRWNEYEAEKLFGKDLSSHIWEKFLNQHDKLKFYADLDKTCRQKLVDRANEIYGK